MSELLTMGAREYQRLLHAILARPTNPVNRRTAYIWGKPYHWHEIEGRLRICSGKSPEDDS